MNRRLLPIQPRTRSRNVSVLPVHTSTQAASSFCAFPAYCNMSIIHCQTSIRVSPPRKPYQVGSHRTSPSEPCTCCRQYRSGAVFWLSEATSDWQSWFRQLVYTILHSSCVKLLLVDECVEVELSNSSGQFGNEISIM